MDPLAVVADRAGARVPRAVGGCGPAEATRLDIRAVDVRGRSAGPCTLVPIMKYTPGNVAFCAAVARVLVIGSPGRQP